MIITYNHIITQHFSSGLQRLASMTTLPAKQKRYLVKHLLPTFQEEIQIYAKLEKEIFEQHTVGTDQQGKAIYNDTDELNKRLEELRSMQLQTFPTELIISEETEKLMSANELFALAPIIQHQKQTVDGGSDKKELSEESA